MFGLFGFVPGQTARFSVAYPSTTEEGTEPVRAQVMLYDSQVTSRAQPRRGRAGRPVPHPRLQPRESAPAGEPNTGRVQVRAVIQVASMDGSERPVKLSVSREVMDNRDGVSQGCMVKQFRECRCALLAQHKEKRLMNE